MVLDCPLDLNVVHEQLSLFTLDNCKKCIETKQKLIQSGVQYREFRIEDCRIVLMNSQLKTLQVAPTIIIRKDGVFKIII